MLFLYVYHIFMAFLQSPSSVVEPMLPLVFLSCSLLSMCFLFVLLYKRFRRVKGDEDESTHNPFSICRTINKIHQSNKAHQLFVEFLTSNSPKLASLCAPICSDCNEGGNGVVCNEGVSDGSELDKEGGDDDCRKSEELGGKKKKKKGKKKRHVDDGGYDPGVEISNAAASQHDKHQCIDCSYPFTSSSSITQRKIKQQYDQLMKSNDSKALTMAQVGQFVNCLIEARNELQHKSEIIKRKFTITKALLLKADRSSFDRISQQIYKLEAEQKRLQEDTNVYNRLQQQLKFSPAYQKMLEIGEQMELKASSGQLVDSSDTDYGGISFEELLAQEKKDTFWQRNGKLRSCVN